MATKTRREAAQSRQRLEEGVDRYGNVKPELAHLIDDFTTTFLEFAHFGNVIHGFADPKLSQVLVDRYKRPLNPLEYYFTDSQLQSMLSLRTDNELLSEQPSKANLLAYVRSDDFLRLMIEKHGEQHARLRQDEHATFIEERLDDKLSVRPLRSIRQLLESSALAEQKVDVPLEEAVVELQEQGLLSAVETQNIAKALNTSDLVPGASFYEANEANYQRAVDRAILNLTPTPDASTPLPYYERLRMEGITPTRRSRSRSSTSDVTTNSKTESLAPNVYPFTIRQGYLGNGLYVDPIKHIQSINDKRLAIQQADNISAAIRTWTPAQLEQLNTFIDYSNEWMVANKMTSATASPEDASEIDWVERKLPSLSPSQTRQKFCELLPRTPPSGSGPEISQPAGALRAVAQAFLNDSISSDAESSSAWISRLNNSPTLASEETQSDIETLFDAAKNVLSKHTSNNSALGQSSHKHRSHQFQRYSPDSSRKLAHQLAETTARENSSWTLPDSLAKAHGVSFSDIDFIRCGENRTDKYSIESTSPWEEAHPNDPSTFIVHSPIRPIPQRQTEAYLKLSWLILREVANMDAEKFVELAYGGTTSVPRLEDIWEAKQLAKHIVDSTAELYRGIELPSYIDPAQVASLMAVDSGHLQSFIASNLQLLGMSAPESTSTSSTSTSSVDSNILRGVLANGTLTQERKDQILRNLSAGTDSTSASPNTTLDSFMQREAESLSKKGDVKAIDAPVKRRLAKMDPSVASLVESLTGSELRSILPLDVIFFHPFLSLEQRSQALLPVIMVDETLAKKFAATGGSLLETLIPASSSQMTARSAYLQSDLPQQILKHLRAKSLRANGALSELGSEVERVSQLLELPPVGISLSPTELQTALESAAESADSEQKDAISSILPSLANPSVAKLFARSVASKSQGDAMLDDPTISAKMEALLANGMPSNLGRDSLAYRTLAADLATYNNAKRTRDSKKAEKDTRPELVRTLRERLQPLLGLVRPESRVLLEPVEADSFDSLLLKQDMIVRLEEQYKNHSAVNALLQKLPAGQDGDFVITNLDGSTTVKKREDVEKELEDSQNALFTATGQQKPTSSVLFSSDAANGDAESVIPPELLASQRDALASELDAISDMLGVQRRPLSEQSVERIQEMMKAWVSEVSGLDILQVWERYPELAPPIPAQAIHGPAREVFDPLTPNRRCISAEVRHMYEPMKQSVASWYLERDQSSAPVLQQPVDETTEMALRYGREIQHKADEFMSAYIVNLSDPTEYVRLFHDALKFAPRLFRQFDLDRDFDVTDAFSNVADILRLHGTIEERIEWFKQFQTQVAHYADVIRSLIGPDGEAYLQYNNMIIQDWLSAYNRDKEGSVEAHEINRLREAVLESGELDNPEERILLHTINIALNLSLDATELDRLKTVQSHIDFERWHLWRLRRKLRHEEKAWDKASNQSSEDIEKQKLNDELLEGHPDKKYAQDYYDEEDDRLMRYKVAEALHTEKLESNLDWNQIYNGATAQSSSNSSASPLDKAGQMAQNLASRLKSAAEAKKDAEHYEAKAEERCIALREKMGLSGDRAARAYQISQLASARIIHYLVSNSLSVTVRENWDLARVESFKSSDWPEIISIDPLFQLAKKNETMPNTDEDELVKPLSRHTIFSQSQAIAETPAQAPRIETFLQDHPWSQLLPLAVLRRLADIQYGERETARLELLAPEFAIAPEKLTLDQARVIVHLGLRLPADLLLTGELILTLARKAITEDPKILQTAVQAESAPDSLRSHFGRISETIGTDNAEQNLNLMYDEVLATDVRKRFPLVNFDFVPGTSEPSSLPPSAASLNAQLSGIRQDPSSDAHLTNEATESHVSNNSGRTATSRLVAAEMNEFRMHAEIDVIGAFEKACAAVRPGAEAESVEHLTETDHERWAVAYQLFSHALVLESVLKKQGSTEGAGGLNSHGSSLASVAGLERIESEFYRLLHQVSLQGEPIPDASITPARLIPWTLIQKMLGYTDRQLKTLILFLADKQHYLEDPKSKPPKLDGFYWDMNEFKAIRNHFLGVNMHPSGIPTREERIFNLLFTEPSSHRLAMLAKRAQHSHETHSSRRSTHLQATSTTYSFEPITNSLIPRAATPVSTGDYAEGPIHPSKMDRLAFAQQEAAKYPLDGDVPKYTAAQAALIAQGMDPALFETAPGLKGLDSIVPLPSATAFSRDIDSFLQQIEKIADAYAPSEAKLKASQIAPPAPVDGITSVRFLPYAPHERISLEEESTELIDPSKASPKDDQVSATTDETAAAADAENAESPKKKEEAKSEEGEAKEKKPEDGEEKKAEDDADEEPEEKSIDWVNIDREFRHEAATEGEERANTEFELLKMYDSRNNKSDLPPFDPHDPLTVYRRHEEMTSDRLSTYNMEELEVDHLIIQRRQLQQVLSTKAQLLAKQMRLLDIKESFPAAYEAVHILESSWSSTLDLTLWHVAPHKIEHRPLLANMSADQWAVSEKFTRRLLIDLAPLMHRSKLSYIPRDELGEGILGLTPGESLFTSFNEGTLIPAPDGKSFYEPKFHFRSLVDPEERTIWAAKREEFETEMNKRSILRNPRKLSVIALLMLAAALYGTGSLLHDYLTQDEDSLTQRAETEAKILSTRAIAGLDRMGVAALQVGNLAISAFKGFLWLFDDSSRLGQTSMVTEFVKLSALPPRQLPGYMVTPETGGYHYHDWLNAGMEEKVQREQSMIRNAFELYERRNRDPEIQKHIKETKAVIEDAVRLAQLRQYEKQKYNFAHAVVKEPKLPEMPDWFEMPENRFWDAPAEFRWLPPTAEKFWRRTNWLYHPDDKAPAVRMITPEETLFHPDTQLSTEGHIEKLPYAPWGPRPIPVPAYAPYEDHTNAARAQRTGSL